MSKNVTPPTAPFAIGGPDAAPTFDVGGPGPYRLARHDARNIALQRRTPAGWATVAYCGNNARAVARVVSELAAEHWTPADGDQALTSHLADLRRAIEKLEETIMRMIEGAPPIR